MPYRHVPSGGRTWKLQSVCQFSAKSGDVSSAARRIAMTCSRPGIGATNGSSPNGPKCQREPLEVVVGERLIGEREHVVVEPRGPDRRRRWRGRSGRRGRLRSRGPRSSGRTAAPRSPSSRAYARRPAGQAVRPPSSGRARINPNSSMIGPGPITLRRSQRFDGLRRDFGYGGTMHRLQAGRERQ